MKRFQTLLFVLAAVGVALVAMLVVGLTLGAEDNSSGPSGPLPSPGDDRAPGSVSPLRSPG